MGRKKTEEPAIYETVRGRERFYDEAKRDMNLKMTPTAIEMLKEKADAMGLSRSELVERIARGTVPLDLDLAMLGELSARSSRPIVIIWPETTEKFLAIKRL